MPPPPKYLQEKAKKIKEWLKKRGGQAKGVWAELLNALLGIEETLPADIDDLAAAARGDIEGDLKQPKIITPEKAYAMQDDLLRTTWGVELATAGALVAAEAGSAGQLDFTLTTLYRLPHYRLFELLSSEIMRLNLEWRYFRPLEQYLAAQNPHVIPSISDLITLTVREVISPEEFEEWALRQGLSATWTWAYWEAHWRLPAPDYLIEAYHRTRAGLADLLNEEELKRYLVWHDYKPEPRPGIRKSDVDIMSGLIYATIPRVDLRRLYELGELSDDELVNRFKALGYTDKDAELMAKAQKLEVYRSERSAVFSELFNDYVDGWLDAETFRAYLIDLFGRETTAMYYFWKAELRRIRELREREAKRLVEAYRYGVLTEDELRKALGMIGMQDWRIEDILREEEHRRMIQEARRRR